MTESHVPFTTALVDAHRRDLLGPGFGPPRAGVVRGRPTRSGRRRGGSPRPGSAD